MCHCIFFGINPRVSKYHAFRHHRATAISFNTYSSLAREDTYSFNSVIGLNINLSDAHTISNKNTGVRHLNLLNEYLKESFIARTRFPSILRSLFQR